MASDLFPKVIDINSKYNKNLDEVQEESGNFIDFNKNIVKQIN